MIRRNLSIYLLVAAILPALMITVPTSDAQARSRTGAFVAGIVIGAAGAAALYHHSNKRWNRARNHYHRTFRRGCHTHNGVRHCHRARSYRASPVYSGRPRPWTRAWYRYCSNKYRSFNPRTGYFTTYSGRKRFCR
ncbi:MULTISPECIES: BA14K family protein [Cohaesibacter]|uniref:BA14K family protein n=1 Tax=Cohaesibacter TaxID=655352 RepID=UPI000DEA2B57|nr:MULTISPECIES: BA14K family protein [Cohaesibacter]TLP48622.1 BA14K family protein [Cohaesibacter sp. CAU 1516]